MPKSINFRQQVVSNKDFSKTISIVGFSTYPNKTLWFLTVKRQQIRKIIQQNEYIPYYKHSKQNPIKE